MVVRASSPPPSVGNTAPDFRQDPETIAFLSENVKKAVRVVIPHYDPALEKEVSLLECQVSFSNLMSSTDLEAHHLSFHQVDLPLTHPKILVFCQSYALVDPSFVPKLTKIDTASRFLIKMGVGKVMGMFLAFPPGQVPRVVYQYMNSLEKLTCLVAKALDFEIQLLQEIIANCQSINQPLLYPHGRAQLLHRLKRRRKSTAELDMGNKSMELRINFCPEEGNNPAHFV